MNRQPDIVALLTWLDNEVSDNEILLPCYQVYRCDRNRHGGGVSIYVHISLYFKPLLVGGPHNLEFLSLCISSKLFYVFHCFTALLLDHLSSTLQFIDPAAFSNCIL